MRLSILRQMNYKTKYTLSPVILSGVTLKSRILSRFSHINSTVDQDDVQRHGNIKDWWDPNGSVLGLHSLNEIRVPFVIDSLVSEADKKISLTPLTNIKILDIGCGAGIYSEGLAKVGAAVTGVDASEDLIKLAKKHSFVDPKIADNRPTYYCSSIEDHSKEFTNNYDAVVASEIIEHVTDKELFLKSCIETLKPGGKLIITTPNKSRWSQIWTIYICENIIKFIPKGTHEYEKFTTPKELTSLLEKHNCKVEMIRGVAYNPFNNKWYWSQYTTLFFFAQATKISRI